MKFLAVMAVNLFLGACVSVASHNRREEAIYYLKEVQLALGAESYEGFSCAISEYSDKSEGIVSAVLLATGENIISWEREKFDKINAIDILLKIDSDILSVGVTIEANRCKEFELYWIID